MSPFGPSEFYTLCSKGHTFSVSSEVCSQESYSEAQEAHRGMPMKKSILGLVAIGALVAGPAMAADLRMPVKAPVAPIVPVFSWTGFYIGANVGGSWGDVPELFSVPALPLSVANTAHPDSIIGGGQIGYNYQIDRVVLGVEADFDARSAHNDFSCFVLAPTGCTGVPPSLLTLHDEQNWLSTVRGRLGFAAFDRVLIYGTGGVAFGNVKHSAIENQTTVAGAIVSASDDSTRTGWAAGAGVEWAVTDQWSVGVEYLHVDLGNTTLSLPGTTVVGVAFNPATATFTDRSDIVRARIDFRFGAGGPLATRY